MREAAALPIHLCKACGTSYPEAAAPPPECPICEDERQFVPRSGQAWTTPERLAEEYANTWRVVEPNLLGIHTEPDFAIGQRALLIRTAHGNVLWDCIALIDDATDVDLDDPDFERTPYDPWIAYGRSKTGDVLMAVAFEPALRDRGIRAAGVHPGGIETELGRHLGGEGIQARLDAINVELAKAGKPPMRLKSVSQGAATTVWAAVTATGDEVGGHYCEDCHVAAVIEEMPSMDALGSGVRAYAVDPHRALALDRLWERLTGRQLTTR